MKLKPCPFCGNPPAIGIKPNFEGQMWHSVQCRCGVRGPVFLEQQELAVQGWNKMCRREP